MDKNDIQKKLMKFIREDIKVDAEELTVDSNIFEEGYVDSILLEKFFSLIEDEFGVLFEEDHFFDERFGTVSGLSDIIIELKEENI